MKMQVNNHSQYDYAGSLRSDAGSLNFSMNSCLKKELLKILQ